MNAKECSVSKTNKKTTPLLLPFPYLPSPECHRVEPRKVKISEFYALSDGHKNVFLNQDSLSGYGDQKILESTRFSYCNLFINGVLQPQSNYHVEEGKIVLHTDDIPIEGSPIILQMITL